MNPGGSLTFERASDRLRDRVSLGELRSERVVVVALVAIAVVGLLVRLGWFGDSLYSDELEAFYDVSSHGLGHTIYLINGHAPELSPPLFFILTWMSEKLFGNSVQSMRLISLLAGVSIIPLTYWLGRLTASIRAGLLAAALVALSPFLTFFSSEARPYSLLVALCLISTLTLVRAVRGGGIGWWVAYAIVSCASIYTHYTAAFLLVLQACWAAAAWPQARRALLAANLFTVVGFLPWIPVVLREARGRGPAFYALFEPLTFRGVRADLGHLWIGSWYQPLTDIPGRKAVAVGAAGLAIAGAGVIVGRVRDPRRRRLAAPSREPVLILLLAFGVPLSVLLYSMVRTTVWNAEDVMTSWPAFAVAVGLLLTAARRAWAAVAIACVIAASLDASIKVLQTRFHRPDYTAAVNYIIATGANRNTPVVNLPDFSPGPVVELEVAFDLIGPSRRHPVLRVGRAPLTVESREPPFTPLTPVPGNVVAGQAARMAGSGKLFLVLPSAVSVAALDALRRAKPLSSSTSNPFAVFVGFMQALPARFHLVGFRAYPGLHRVAVYTFQG